MSAPATSQAHAPDAHHGNKFHLFVQVAMILAVITGALRSWLMARGVGVSQGDTMKAMLPISIAVPNESSGYAGGNRVSATLVQLPVGATLEQTQAVLSDMRGYFDANEKEAVESFMSVAGIGMAGRGQLLRLAAPRCRRPPLERLVVRLFKLARARKLPPAPPRNKTVVSDGSQFSPMRSTTLRMASGMSCS